MALTCYLMSLCHMVIPFGSFEQSTTLLIYITTDICHDHQFSLTSLLDNVFKPRLLS